MTAIPEPTTSPPVSGLPDHLVAVSDLHLGVGADPATGRYRLRENFLADRAFANMLEVIVPDGETAVLILNGDIFDFLRIVHIPTTGTDFQTWSDLLGRLRAPANVPQSVSALANSIKHHERRYGLQTNDYKSVWKLHRIAVGHPTFFAGLAGWVNRGRDIAFIKGNHDVELFWPLVQAAVRDAVTHGGAKPGWADAHVQFVQDRLPIANVRFEHGHQFEPLTRVTGSPTLRHQPDQLNLPTGSFINRYIINPLEGIEPYLDNIKPVTDVVLAVVRRHPLKSIGILWRSLRLLTRAFRKRAWREGFAFLFFGLAILIPVVTIGLIVLAVAWPRFGSWIAETLGRYRFILSVLGVAAPFLLGALRELLPKKKPRVGDDRYAEGAWVKLAGAIPKGAPPVRYAVLGHTHVQDIQRLPAIDGSAVIYLNTGSWIPSWRPKRPDLTGAIHYPVVLFDRTPEWYTHRYLEWLDGPQRTRHSVIVAQK